MEEAVSEVLAQYDRRAAAEAELMRKLTRQEAMRRVDEWLIHVGEPVGRLLNLLVRETGASRILELGTAYGYSTIWLAEAARAVGGRVLSLELHPDKQAHARDALRRAGLDGQVELILGDARELIPTLDGAFDFVLIDLWKDLYVPCFDLLRRKLAMGGIVVADNMLHPAEHRPHAEAYRERVRATPGMASVLLPIGNGIELSRREAAGYFAD
jgi:predicted O-methyltransferase YrrM